MTDLAAIVAHRTQFHPDIAEAFTWLGVGAHACVTIARRDVRGGKASARRQQPAALASRVGREGATRRSHSDGARSVRSWWYARVGLGHAIPIVSDSIEKAKDLTSERLSVRARAGLECEGP